MRWRITIRGDGTELRGYFGGSKGDLQLLSLDLKKWGLVMASPADDDYDPFNPPVPPNDWTETQLSKAWEKP